MFFMIYHSPKPAQSHLARNINRSCELVAVSPEDLEDAGDTVDPVGTYLWVGTYL
jgi:hypothetical protein